jgi:hypothetical protein
LSSENGRAVNAEKRIGTVKRIEKKEQRLTSAL